MTVEQPGTGVGLPQAHTGSSYFHQLLVRACESFPELAQAQLPAEARSFKQRFSELLPRFEAARRASPARLEIARFLVREAERELTFSDAAGTRGLDEVMASPSEPLPWVKVDLPGPGRLMPSVSFEGRLHQSARLLGLAAELEAKRWMTPAARDALAWINERAQDERGLSLRGERFVLLGAAAELSPVELLLAAGAEVLWIDLREPGVDLLLAPRLGGSLRYVRGGANLLTAPHAIAATVRRFAAEGAPVHLGMYAYAGGESQEWRLTASMNAIARNLPRSVLASCTMLISPTSPGGVCAEDFAHAQKQKAEAPRWMRSLFATRQLRDGFELGSASPVARAIVKTQGVSYQAAQYFGKLLAAEAYAAFGNQLEPGAAPLTVSANVAPITATRSLSHPVFEAAFLGAPAFHILIAKPDATRTLATLLTLHDLVNPDAPGAAHGANGHGEPHGTRVLTQQIHGGVYSQPYALEGCISVAALRGLTRKPGLALGIFR
ncbi:MAG: hypothetical protein QM778_26180 [Myxococcales bacterium]